MRSVMMFAAGRGTRMGALTDDQPKPMIEVAGQPLIRHALDQTKGMGLNIVANVHWQPDRLEALLRAEGVTISDERAALLETGGGLRKALPLLGEGPVFTLNADAVWHGPSALAVLREAWDPERMDTLLLCVPHEAAFGHSGSGAFLLDEDGLARRGPGLIYTGASITSPQGLAEIDEAAFSLNRLWDAHLGSGRLYGVRYPGRWCDVGTPQGIAAAEAMLAETAR